jgi:hypothetical protein
MHSAKEIWPTRVASCLSVAILANDQAGIVAAEAEAVADGRLQAALAGLIWGVIQITLRIGSIQINRGRDHAIAKGQDTEN